MTLTLLQLFLSLIDRLLFFMFHVHHFILRLFSHYFLYDFPHCLGGLPEASSRVLYSWLCDEARCLSY
jgi:hypothetical protein